MPQEDPFFEQLRAAVWKAGLAGEPFDFPAIESRRPEEKIKRLKRRYRAALKVGLPTEEDDRKQFNSDLYELRKKVGGGNFGRVYKAKEKSLGRPRAIKILKKKTSLTRGSREAQLLSEINSHFVVQVERIDNLDDGRLYIVMHWVEGESMDKYIVPGQLPGEEKALRWMQQCCEGMGDLARRGIVHRDLKPENIMIEKERDVVKICDMGLAKQISDDDHPSADSDELHAEITLHSSPDRSASTFAGFGTLYFMAPEQAFEKTANEKSDIYSFGASFYWLLTGKKVFEDIPQEDFERAWREDAPESPRSIDEDISTELDWLIMKCLETEPGKRFQSFEKIEAELEKITRQTSVPLPGEEFFEGVKEVAEHRIGLPEHRRQQARGPGAATTWQNRGIEYFSEEDPESAIKSFTKAIGLDPKDPENWFRRALAYFFSDYSNHLSIEDCNAAIIRNPRFVEALSHRGWMHELNRDYDEAIEDYSEAIRLDPMEPDHLRNRGNVYCEIGDHDKAIEDYSKAISLYPLDALVWFDRGCAYADKGDHDKAIKDFDEALGIEANDPLYLYYRGRSYAAKRDYDRAITDYSRSIASETEDEKEADRADAFFHRGFAYAEKDEYELAIDDYTESIQIENENAAAWLYRGLAYLEAANIDMAIEDFTMTIGLKPESKDGWFFRGLAHAGENRFDAAIGDYDYALRLDPEDPDTLRYRGRAYLGKNDYDKAITDFNEALRLYPGDSNTRKDLEKARSSRNKASSPSIESSITQGELKQLQQLHSSGVNLNVEALITGGLEYAEKGDHLQAIEKYSLAIKLEPTSSKAWFFRGTSYHESDEIDKAIVDYSTAFRCDPDNFEALRLRGHAHREKGDHALVNADFKLADEIESRLGNS